ncbi:hypothetical protein GW17_00023780 [Ensete ventricosum]|nr:hypothetical protein GW17_00023780 [Ensete ventricosum]
MLLGRCDGFVREGHRVLQSIYSVLMWQIPNFHCHGIHHMAVSCNIFPCHVLDLDICLSTHVHCFFFPLLFLVTSVSVKKQKRL